MTQPQAVQAMLVASRGKPPPLRRASLCLLLQNNLLWSVHFAPVRLEGLCSHPHFTKEEPKAPTDEGSKLGSPQRTALKLKEEMHWSLKNSQGVRQVLLLHRGRWCTPSRPRVPAGSLSREPVEQMGLCLLAKVFCRAGDLCVPGWKSSHLPPDTDDCAAESWTDPSVHLVEKNRFTGVTLLTSYQSLFFLWKGWRSRVSLEETLNLVFLPTSSQPSEPSAQLAARHFLGRENSLGFVDFPL